MKFYAVYTCPMCNTQFRISDTPAEIDKESGPELVASIIRNQTMLGNPYLYQAPMHLPHNCKNGCIGIAQLSGFKPASDQRSTTEEKDEKKPFIRISRKRN